MKHEFRWITGSLVLGVILVTWQFHSPRSGTPGGKEKLDSQAGQNPTSPAVQNRSPAKALKSAGSNLTNQFPAAPNKTGAYRTRAELVAAQDSGEIVWAQVENPSNVLLLVRGGAIEPFPELTLRALEEVLRTTDNRNHKLAVAAILYRYGRETGRSALLEAVRAQGADNDTLNAATSLMLNRDLEALPNALKLVGGSGWTHAAFMDAVGRWKHPEITATLELKIQEQPKFFDFALPLAWHGQDSAGSFLKDALKRKADNGFTRIQLEAGLARIGQFNPEEFLLHTDQVITQARHGAPINRAYEIAGSGISTPALLRHLEQYIGRHEEWIAGVDRQAEMARNNDPNTYRSYPKNAPTDMMLAAVRILTEWDAKAAIPPLERIIQQVQKRKPDNLNNLQLGLALYKLDPVGWRATLEEAGIQTAMLDRIPEVAKLRPLAPELMPQQKYWLSRPAP